MMTRIAFALLLFLCCSRIALAQGNFPIGKTPTVIASAGSLGANYTSPYVWIGGVSNIDCQLVWTGTPTGTFGVSVSEDATNFDALTLSGSVIGGGAAGHGTIELATLGAPYMEITYTRTSSTGTLTSVTCFGKARQ